MVYNDVQKYQAGNLLMKLKNMIVICVIGGGIIALRSGVIGHPDLFWLIWFTIATYAMASGQSFSPMHESSDDMQDRRQQTDYHERQRREQMTHSILMNSSSSSYHYRHRWD